MNITIQVQNLDATWSVINKRQIREGMSDVQKAEILSDLADLLHGWGVSDKFRGAQLRLHVEKECYDERG